MESPMMRRLPGLIIVAALLANGSISVFAQAKADLTGKWLFTVVTTAGPGTPTITLKQEGEMLTGHYSGQLGESDLTGSIKGAELVFKFTVDVQGFKLVCTYTGTVESKDSLKGTVDITNLGNGTFTASRQ